MVMINKHCLPELLHSKPIRLMTNREQLELSIMNYFCICEADNSTKALPEIGEEPHHCCANDQPAQPYSCKCDPTDSDNNRRTCAWFSVKFLLSDCK